MNSQRRIRFLVTVAIVSLGVSAPADAAEKVLLERETAISLPLVKVTCREGLPPGDDHFPERTKLSFDLPSYELLDQRIWTNVNSYQVNLGSSRCSEFKDVIDHPLDVPRTAIHHQKISQEARKNSLGDCLMVSHEVASVKIGKLTFEGHQCFTIAPLDGCK